jgi:hypothetical protein
MDTAEPKPDTRKKIMTCMPQQMPTAATAVLASGRRPGSKEQQVAGLVAVSIWCSES